LISELIKAQPLFPWVLTFGFAALGVVMLVICVFLKRTDLAVKLTGTSLVLALAFASGSALTYAIGMFVVATLVTELEFLEKIAAIFWRSEPYFRYRLAIATNQDRQEKLTREVEADLTGRGSEARTVEAMPASAEVSRRVREGLLEASKFEGAVSRAIASGKPPFTGVGRLRRDIRIETNSFRGVIDFIYALPWAHYVVEAKNVAHVSQTNAHAVAHYADMYHAYLAERGSTTPVIPVLIVPVTATVPERFLTSVFVVRFDGENFVDATELPRP
jgi:hypothetical protein